MYLGMQEIPIVGEHTEMLGDRAVCLVHCRGVMVGRNACRGRQYVKDRKQKIQTKIGGSTQGKA